MWRSCSRCGVPSKSTGRSCSLPVEHAARSQPLRANSQVVADTDGSGNLTALYVRVGDELLAVMRPGSGAGTWTTRFVHSDGLGSVRVLTDETGPTSIRAGTRRLG
jgi:hypothetical protein